jgi:hypothetical protein
MWAVALIVAAITHFATATLSFGARCKVENTFKDAGAAHAEKTLIQDLDHQVCFAQPLPLEYILIRHLNHPSSNGVAGHLRRPIQTAAQLTHLPLQPPQTSLQLHLTSVPSLASKLARIPA